MERSPYRFVMEHHGDERQMKTDHADNADHAAAHSPDQGRATR